LLDIRSPGITTMPTPDKPTSIRDRAIASVEKRIGEVEAYLAACDGTEGQGSAAAASRFLQELRRMLATQRGSSETGGQ
jgi:hypothetical protein